MLEFLVMAGEIEEPFSLSFRADSLHSGSISFGRFETESLSWERRSSFSYNRYLEEVEKYSKPGSVTEKKAYFEAHFKKKALLSQSSSECRNGTEYQTSENDFSENGGYREEFKHVNEGSDVAHFDGSPHGSGYDGEFDVMECGREDVGSSSSEPQGEPALNNADVVDGVPAHMKAEKMHQTETVNLLLVNAETETEVNENLNDDPENVDVTFKEIDPSPNSHTAGKDDTASSGHQQDPSPELKAASETKFTKTRSKSQVNVTQVRKNVSSEASKDSAKKPSIREREGSLKTKTENQSSRNADPTTRRTLKPEECESSKAKANHEKKSEKELRAKKLVEPRHAGSEKVVPRARETANRPKKTASSTKPGMKQSAAGFNFRSDERAERRKQFSMKLEEKWHAKEDKINQIQAKMLEKTEAEIKQFRRSLNFKAAPMPSFYHESVKQGSDKNKAVSSSTKSMKVRGKSLSTGGGDAANSSTFWRAGKDQTLSASDPIYTTDPPQASGVTNCSLTVPSETSAISLTPSTSRSQPPKAELTGKKEKEKDMDLQKNRVLDGSKMPKGQKAEEKWKVGAGRSSNEMGKKHMKVASGMGHLAVGVAS
ncbi:hypothetical protein F0562_033448 [Nyssa sinensis]|uniref:TPX2 C-terminal domain-containing protein n=1 Tax=Nyssa sinensis TaxID=561372 RepID=A0A5J5AFM9_9ASTE|nr:hypothetical protein F0562_033448 [Nyssa sinensis]